MWPDKTDQANGSTQTHSYQGTWVEMLHSPEQVFEDGDDRTYEDDNP